MGKIRKGVRLAARFFAVGLALIALHLSVYRLVYPHLIFGRIEGVFIDPIFYAAQWPLLALGWFPLLWLCLVKRKRRMLGWALLAVALTTTRWLSETLWLCPQLDRTPDSIRLVSWTADEFEHRKMEKSAVDLAELEPDISLTLEGVVDFGRQTRAFPPHFPDHTMRWRSFGMMTLSTLKDLKSSAKFFDNRNGTATVMELETKTGQKFTLIGYDQRSTPTLSRGPALKELASFVGTLSGPVIIAGDFNTPSDSPHFTPLRATLRNAFHEVGRGLETTWPSTLPLLSLDQIWISEKIIPLKIKHKRLNWIGHQALIFDFEIQSNRTASEGLTTP